MPFDSLDILKKLSGGKINDSYLIEADSQRFVLRVSAIDKVIPGIDRKREKTILSLASDAELAPTVVYHSLERGILISEYIEGLHPSQQELNDPDNIQRLRDKIRNIHNIHHQLPVFDYRQHAENYWHLLNQKNIEIHPDLHKRRDDILQWIDFISEATLLCHHDLNPRNIITTSNDMFFLDWEYAAPGWPAFDYACVLCEWELPLKSPLIPSSMNKDKIEQAMSLYLYLCDLWSLLNTRTTDIN